MQQMVIFKKIILIYQNTIGIQTIIQFLIGVKLVLIKKNNDYKKIFSQKVFTFKHDYI